MVVRKKVFLAYIISFYVEDGSGKLYLNVGTYVPECTMSRSTIHNIYMSIGT